MVLWLEISMVVMVTGNGRMVVMADFMVDFMVGNGKCMIWLSMVGICMIWLIL